jgi:peptide/nickel transport system ATP-binding protein
MPEEKKLCLSGKGVTKIFGFGRTRTLAVDHVDFQFYEGEIASRVNRAVARPPWRRCSWG